MLQGIEKGAQSRLVVLDDAVLPVLGALLDKSSGVGGEWAIVVVEVEPLRVPLGMI
jgi:hypothetical protein